MSAETVESAAKKLKEAERQIQEATTELRVLEQTPTKPAGGKEASSSLHVTLTEVAGNATSPPALHLHVEPEGLCAGSASAKLPATSASSGSGHDSKKFVLTGDVKGASLKVKAGNGADSSTAVTFSLAAVAEEKDATSIKSVEGAGSTYTLKIRLNLTPAAKTAALRRKLDKLYKNKKQCEETVRALLTSTTQRPGQSAAVARAGGVASHAGSAKGAKGAAEPKWRKYARLSSYPKTVERAKLATELAVRHKNILLFVGGVAMMHWKGDELAC